MGNMVPPMESCGAGPCAGVGLAAGHQVILPMYNNVSTQNPAPPRRQREPDGISIERISQETIALTECPAEEEETNLETLTKVVEEQDYNHISKGTKRALLAGCGHYNGQLSGQRWKPKLPLGAGSWFLRALADTGSTLKAGSNETKNCEHATNTSLTHE